MTIALSCSFDGVKMIPCDDSKASCRAALKYMRGAVADKQSLAEWSDFAIVTAACEPKGEKQALGVAMARYLVEDLVAPVHAVKCLKAPFFYTLGEMIALVRYIKRVPSIERAVVFVKYWHALRCQEILLQLLEWEGLDVKVRIVALESDPEPAAIHREFWVGTLKNMLPLALCWCWYKILRQKL